jgi:hypothetical protein
MGTTVSASDIQPVIDLSAKYKFIEKAFPATELISDASARSPVCSAWTSAQSRDL